MYGFSAVRNNTFCLVFILMDITMNISKVASLVLLNSLVLLKKIGNKKVRISYNRLESQYSYTYR